MAHVYRRPASAGRPACATATSGRRERRPGVGRRAVASNCGYAAGWRLVRALPRPPVAAAFRARARTGPHRRGGGGASGCARNLRRVVGPELPEAELDALVRRGLRSYARYWLEAFRLPALSRAADPGRLPAATARELLAADVAAGRGAVVALPHAGNWDAAGAWVAADGWPITTVAERLKPEGVYERFVAFRESLGMEILPAHRRRRGRRSTCSSDRLRGRVRRAAAGRPGPVRPRRRGRLLRRPDPDAGRPGAARAAHRRAALRGLDCGTSRTAACASLAGPLPVPRPDAGRWTQRVAALTQAIADRLAAGIAGHPARLAHAAADVAGRRRPGRRRGEPRPPRIVEVERADADRHRLPVLLRRARRGAEPCAWTWPRR